MLRYVPISYTALYCRYLCLLDKKEFSQETIYIKSQIVTILFRKRKEKKKDAWEKFSAGWTGQWKVAQKKFCGLYLILPPFPILKFSLC